MGALLVLSPCLSQQFLQQDCIPLFLPGSTLIKGLIFGADQVISRSVLWMNLHDDINLHCTVFYLGSEMLTYLLTGADRPDVLVGLSQKSIK